MKKDFDAKKTLHIHAPIPAVWEALTRPELIRQYMHGTTAKSDWQVGSPITWTGEYNGKAYEDKGVILAFEPQKRISYTHWSSMGGSQDKPENYHTVTFELTEEHGHTSLALTQSNNPSQEEADKMAENNWGPILQGLKSVVEKQHAV
jgi:uncharacterized protein YndB with AHSA1/START domain